jgi:regulatory LuxR family protein
VLELLPTHLSTAAIGEALHISRNTVKAHLRTIYRKLDVATRAPTRSSARPGTGSCAWATRDPARRQRGARAARAQASRPSQNSRTPRGSATLTGRKSGSMSRIVAGGARRGRSEGPRSGAPVEAIGNRDMTSSRRAFVMVEDVVGHPPRHSGGSPRTPDGHWGRPVGALVR